jgi:hypothetical protein
MRPIQRVGSSAYAVKSNYSVRRTLLCRSSWNLTASNSVLTHINTPKEILMRYGIQITLAILLTAFGCTPLKPVSGPGPTAIPTPSEDVTIIQSTAVITCACPTGMGVTLGTQPGGITPPSLICNCPNIRVTESVQPAEDTGTVKGVTLHDNGKTITMRPGETFLLDLGIDLYDWTVEVDNRNVLSRVPNIMVIRGAQGIYKAHDPGTATLTATGDPFCRKSTPACGMPSMIFHLTVTVQ